MCRSIKTLREPYTEHVTDADVRAAALQYVRKVSGFRAPAAHNAEAFDRAVDTIALSFWHWAALSCHPAASPAASAATARPGTARAPRRTDRRQATPAGSLLMHKVAPRPPATGP